MRWQRAIIRPDQVSAGTWLVMPQTFLSSARGLDTLNRCHCAEMVVHHKQTTYKMVGGLAAFEKSYFCVNSKCLSPLVKTSIRPPPTCSCYNIAGLRKAQQKGMFSYQ